MMPLPPVTLLRTRSKAKQEGYGNEPLEQANNPDETPNKRRSRQKERGEGLGVGVHSPYARRQYGSVDSLGEKQFS